MDPDCDPLEQSIHTEHKWPPRDHNRRFQGKGHLKEWAGPKYGEKAWNEVGTKTGERWRQKETKSHLEKGYSERGA